MHLDYYAGTARQRSQISLSPTFSNVLTFTYTRSAKCQQQIGDRLGTQPDFNAGPCCGHSLSPKGFAVLDTSRILI